MCFFTALFSFAPKFSNEHNTHSRTQFTGICENCVILWLDVVMTRDRDGLAVVFCGPVSQGVSVSPFIFTYILWLCPLLHGATLMDHDCTGKEWMRLIDEKCFREIKRNKLMSFLTIHAVLHVIMKMKLKKKVRQLKM